LKTAQRHCVCNSLNEDERYSPEAGKVCWNMCWRKQRKNIQ